MPIRLPPQFLPSEHDVQANFFTEVQLEFRLDPTFRAPLLYAVLNGAWINVADREDSDQNLQRRKQKLLEKYSAEGWKAGIADVMYDQPRGRFSKLVFEFKKETRRGVKNGGLSPEQIIYLREITPYAFVRVVYSTDEAMSLFRQYMEQPLWGRSSVETVISKMYLGETEKDVPWFNR